ncbi:flagellar basal body-associated protein FliL [Lamprobacter modestohalophilus]|uniref:Flagellar protein FliL n=1 Tax=Lamprobacter modestohalophilus TaxID=1064514 RepID=A0A9X1B3F2_9GAMM|nr:flagellar basal body-associated protein FliL [Lamprobacter modestohalophilus]MCF7976987.1 flagellar basal body-associated protein FliL [Chromatiaceae bacterium]MCF7994581.1 flagellar basal body-associated protein FliL [Chromatiaceae bacterium]MCF8005350.1 flagellar basal body-associated protein FliL [Chromatiaceae bacterium]MCF8014090.1 flagellar basal body-associated protein FliL [Chromatiaceae bacterium]
MAESKGGSRKLLWVLIILVVLSIIAAGISVYLTWQSEDDSPAEKNVVTDRSAPIFVKIEPFTINIKSSRGVSHLLYVGMSFKVSTEETRDIFEDHMPQVRSRLLMQLSSEQVDELTSIEGKTQLANRLITSLQDPPLAELQPELAIEEVLFTEFIVQ